MLTNERELTPLLGPDYDRDLNPSCLSIEETKEVLFEITTMGIITQHLPEMK